MAQQTLEHWLAKTYGSFGKKLTQTIEDLSEKQREFCDAYLACGSAPKAAKQVGLNVPSASLLLHTPKFAAYLNIATAKREVELGRASAAEMLERLRATPVLASDDLVPPDILRELDAQLADNAAAVAEATDDELLENIDHGSDVDYGIQQVPPVKLVLQNPTFGPGWVLEQIIRVAERCLQIEPVYDKRGRPVGQFQFQANAALKALELLGKNMALFQGDVPQDPLPKSPEEVEQRIQALLAAHPDLAKAFSRVLNTNGKVIEHEGLKH